MAEIYRRFATESGLDFSDEAAEEMYLFETTGKGDLQLGLFAGQQANGFAVGKRWMDVTVKMWKADIRGGILWRHELEDVYPAWFLDRVL